MRHALPSGDPAVIFERALVLLVAELERKKLAHTDRPRTAPPTDPKSRHIPAAVRRAVWQRDGGRCAFGGAQGRCNETGFLEFHHVKPFADGGQASPANIELRCRAHNVYEANEFFARPESPSRGKSTLPLDPWRARSGPSGFDLHRAASQRDVDVARAFDDRLVGGGERAADRARSETAALHWPLDQEATQPETS